MGKLVPQALKSVRKGARVVCAGIHMSDLPSFLYRFLWEERKLVKTTPYPLRCADEALADLRTVSIDGAAVLTV